MAADNAPHECPVALLLIDVVNHFEYPDGDRILRNALPLAARIARLKKRARAAGIPAIYVNDNFGQWRSDARRLVDYCVRQDAPGKAFVEPLRPEDEDYFVLKPMHSGFFQTPLEVLLKYLGASTLILTGLATNSCILSTAQDARMRDLQLFVPEDCAAARSGREHRHAIEHIRDMVGADTTIASSLRLRQMVKARRS